MAPLAPQPQLIIWIAWLGFGALFLFLFVRTWIDRWLTELAVTNNRIIYKYGLIRRYTAEMNMDKVESVNVVQSILGRLLDYGTIDIMGTGQGFESLRELRRRSSCETPSSRSSEPEVQRAAVVGAALACVVRRVDRPSSRSRSFSKVASIGPSSARPRGSRMRIGSTKRPFTRIS